VCRAATERQLQNKGMQGGLVVKDHAWESASVGGLFSNVDFLIRSVGNQKRGRGQRVSEPHGWPIPASTQCCGAVPGFSYSAPRHCERSEAIQLWAMNSGLLRRIAPRNDGKAVDSLYSNMLRIRQGQRVCPAGTPPRRVFCVQSPAKSVLFAGTTWRKQCYFKKA